MTEARPPSMTLVDNLIQRGYLKTPRIIEAFKKIKRENFLPSGSEDLAEIDDALPIGFGQTISQPLVVAFMLELLRPEPGDKILDVGSGSGWTTGLLAEIVAAPDGRASPEGRGERGKVIAIELVPELKEFGEKNVARYNFIEKGIAEFVCTDGSKGFKEEAPFDKILASAAAQKLPQAWKEQLKVGGKIVVPINSSIWRFVKTGDSMFKEEEYSGFVFVPLIEEGQR